ncbi:hypothetical protein [Rathayibacter iranicus]|uniref:Uncharacterized protein n=1 Tax=Rathayibacter iranicus NCPPB 2253 = VKM Ac-1602 TaxID=1328868 RepID=A0ABX5LFB1_9MICO|nr:hypothetical protein [Rathayibacter iranicus]MWV31311.1 hypothetical protein [Rathayibacter iranicus NCPPB 2253 = VKM Ac-1602]PWJ63661.1 hypothetical protein B0H03_107130 [Rathayibacter iranicus NCPPB 2253 = VKM Ac-1602]
MRVLTRLTFDCLRAHKIDVPDLMSSGGWNDVPPDFDWKEYRSVRTVTTSDCRHQRSQ